MSTVKQYENQLRDLKTNSKPMINSLTMMAEDCIRQAELIVEVTEKQLRKVDPEFKLPILYLIDSIVKNVKQEYVAHFSTNIVNTFTQTFEQVKKVPDKTRRELWKLRQTWNEVFAYNKLYSIDIRCHQIDPGWPVIAPPHTSSKIHVNPKFLQKALTSTGSPASSTTTTPSVPTSTSSPSLSLPGLNDITATLASDADMDPSFKAQLLMKQKELLELQAKKIELELLAAQKQYELSKIQQRPVEQAKLEAETETKQQQLLHQAELAKLQKDRAATLLSSAPPTSQVPSITVAPPTDTFQDPRRRRTPDKKKLEARDGHRQRLSPTPVTHLVPSHPVSQIAIIPPLPLSSALISQEFKHLKSPEKRERKRSRDRTPPPPKESRTIIPSPSRSPTKKSTSPVKEPGPMDDPRKRKSNEVKGRKESKDSRESSSRRSRQSSSSSSAVSPTHESEVPSKRRKKSSESREKEERDDKRKGSKSSSRRRRDSGDKPKEYEATNQRKTDNLNARKNAVLKKNYRRTTEVAKMEDDEDKKENAVVGQRRSEGMLPLTLGGDVDLRTQILHDVDLRNEALGTEGDKTESSPPLKKARNGTIIDDLFGREDVDYRQQGASSSLPATPTTTTWAQVKKPTRTDSQDDETTLQDILNQSHPPPPISPATSIDSSRGGCDPLGRPLLYNRLPDDPAERKRSLDSRTSIDPVERFRNQFIEQPSISTGNLSNRDLQQAVMNAKDQLELGVFNREQFATVWRQLMQINEVNKIRDLEMQYQVQGDRPGPNPWTGTDSWGQFGGGGDFAPGPFGTAVPAPAVPPAPNPWGTPSVTWGQEQPRGPNPFEEAAAAVAMNAPPPSILEDVIPPVDPLELNKVRNDSAGTIPIDKVLRQVRFYGETAVVLQGSHGDEPREISFHRGTPKNVFIDKEREPVRCFIGKPAMIYLDRQKHTLKLGAPTRELYIDGDHYEACFGGPPIRVQVGRYFHSFKLEGPPPQVELGKVPRFDLLAGRVNLFVDGNAVGVYLDDKPQLLDLCGFPVIIRFVDNFHKVLLNNRPFPVEFGGPPMRVSIPSGRKHFLRFTALSAKTRKAMVEFNKARESDDGGYYRSGGRGRGGRRGGQRFNPPMEHQHPPQEFHTPAPGDNPLDELANMVPHDVLNTSAADNSYESLGQTPAEPIPKSEESSTAAGLDVQDLLSKLMMAGLLPAAPKEEVTEVKDEVKEVKVKPKKEEKKPKPPPKEVKENIPPLETVDVSWDRLKERRDKLIAQICTGIQCGSCGLRFAPDQNVRYSQHLDWHFRQNRREKANAKKALSRKWYYDLSDWIQFAEIEDLEERAQSMFEPTEEELDQDTRSPGTVLNPDLYTVPSASHEGAICPQCNEGFESFYDEDKEEWRLRDAFLAESDEPGVMKLYHPICHQDFMAAAQGLSTLIEPEPEPEPQEEKEEPKESVAEEPVEEPATSKMETAEAEEEEEDEVTILKEGKPEPVVMDIIEDDDEAGDDDKIVPENQSSEAQIVLDDLDSNGKDSDNQNSDDGICKNVVVENGDDRNVDLMMADDNNKTEELQSHDPHDDEHDSSIVTHTISSTEPIPSSSTPPPPATVEEQIPEIAPPAELDFFDLILQGGSSPYATDDIEQVEERPYKPIVYPSMKFDNPTPIIKDEPMDVPEELEEPQTLDFEIRMNLPLEVETGPVEAIDIDLTEDGDTMDDLVPSQQAFSAIDGNIHMNAQAPAPVSKVVSGPKIKINILDAVLSMDSLSPKQSPSRALDSSTSPKGSEEVKSGESESTTGSTITEDSSKSKPRFHGVKLRNYPTKQTGQEVSGLCTIC